MEEQQDNKNEVEELAKQTANTIVNNTKQKVKQKIFQKVATFLATNIVLIIKLILILCVVGLLMAAFQWVVDVFTADNVSEKTKNMIEEYCIITEDGIKFEKEKIKQSLEEELATGRN